MENCGRLKKSSSSFRFQFAAFIKIDCISPGDPPFCFVLSFRICHSCICHVIHCGTNQDEWFDEMQNTLIRIDLWNVRAIIRFRSSRYSGGHVPPFARDERGKQWKWIALPLAKQCLTTHQNHNNIYNKLLPTSRIACACGIKATRRPIRRWISFFSGAPQLGLSVATVKCSHIVSGVRAWVWVQAAVFYAPLRQWEIKYSLGDERIHWQTCQPTSIQQPSVRFEKRFIMPCARRCAVCVCMRCVYRCLFRICFAAACTSDRRRYRVPQKFMDLILTWQNCNGRKMIFALIRTCGDVRDTPSLPKAQTDLRIPWCECVCVLLWAMDAVRGPWARDEWKRNGLVGARDTLVCVRVVITNPLHHVFVLFD